MKSLVLAVFIFGYTAQVIATTKTPYIIAGTIGQNEAFAVSVERHEVMYFGPKGSFLAGKCKITLNGPGCDFTGNAKVGGKWGKLVGYVRQEPPNAFRDAYRATTKVHVQVMDGTNALLTAGGELR